MSICPACKQEVSFGATYKKKLYHPECYQKMINAARAKDAKKSASLADPDLLSLRQYVLEHFELEELSPLLEKQIEALSKKYSYADIQYSLHYFFDLNESGEQTIEPSIGIVPYIYKEAMEYRDRLTAAQEHNNHFVPPPDETVYIRPRKSTYIPMRYNIEDY